MVQKKIIISVLLAVMTVSLNGCGNQESNTVNVQSNIDTEDMIYESTPVNIEGVEGSIKKGIYRNECLYFITESTDDQGAETKSQKVYFVDADGSHLQEIPLNIKESEYIDVFDMDADGNFIYLLRNTDEVRDYSGQEVYRASLVKAAADGTERKRIECDSFLDKKKEEDVRSAIAEFNKSSKDYRIVVKDYHEEENARLKMNLDIASGKAPDIIDLAACNADEYISKGLVEDLL